MQRVQDSQKPAHYAEIQIGYSKHLLHLPCLVRYEKPENRAPENEHADGYNNRRDKRHYDCISHALPYTLKIACPKILRRVGCDCKTEGNCSRLKQSVKLISGGIACNKQKSIAVHDRLQYHSSYAYHGILEYYRETDYQQPLRHCGMYADVLPVYSYHVYSSYS